MFCLRRRPGYGAHRRFWDAGGRSAGLALRVVGIRQTDQGGNEVADKYVTFAYAASGAMERIVRYESLDTSELVAVSEYTYDLGR